MKYWNPIETADRQEIEKLQSERLRNMVERVYNNVPFYRQKFDEIGLKPADIRGIEDLQKLPFTTKQDLRDNYPFGLFAVPQSEVVRIHASSGTTGHPTVVGCTKNDIEMWSECFARSLTMAGIDKNDIAQIAYGYGLFTGGLGTHYGFEKVGASVIPISGGNTKKQLQLMVDFGTTVLACTPSYAAYLAESVAENGLQDKIKLRKGVFGAEPWSQEMRSYIEKTLNIKAYNIYGLSEVIGPGVSMECDCQCGSHIQEDHFIPEIIDPATGKVLPYGEVGELVFTTVTKEALPLVRYRTRDLTKLIVGKCECGRTTIRMAPVMGRSDDMLIIRGVNVFPSQIESALMEVYETSPNYQLVVDRVNNLDTLEIKIELTDELWTSEIKEIESLKKRIMHNISSIVGLNAAIKFVEPHTLERSEGKAKRVIDNRKI